MYLQVFCICYKIILATTAARIILYKVQIFSFYSVLVRHKNNIQ